MLCYLHSTEFKPFLKYTANQERRNKKRVESLIRCGIGSKRVAKSELWRGRGFKKVWKSAILGGINSQKDAECAIRGGISNLYPFGFKTVSDDDTGDKWASIENIARFRHQAENAMETTKKKKRWQWGMHRIPHNQRSRCKYDDSPCYCRCTRCSNCRSSPQ